MLTAPNITFSEPTVSVRILKSLVAALARMGISPARLLHEAGVDPSSFDGSEGRIPRRAMYALFEHAVALSGNPELGLHWSEQGLNGVTLAPISPLVAHAATLGQALEVLERYGKLLTDQAGYEVVALDAQVALRTVHPPEASRAARRVGDEYTMLGFYRLIRGFAPDAPAPRVHFAHPPPPQRDAYVRLFGTSAHFAQPHTEIVFDRALLEVRSPHQDDDVHEALRTVAERRIVRLATRVPYALRVRELLLVHGAHCTDMKEVARHLGLSVRSLRRRLAGESKSYHQVALEALALTAKRHLRDQRMSIQETAFAMGFSDTSTFHRAFKRWTGMTPSAYRDADAAHVG